jgi:hypothetical protein
VDGDELLEQLVKINDSDKNRVSIADQRDSIRILLLTTFFKRTGWEPSERSFVAKE